jgi:biofilm protein TabA
MLLLALADADTITTLHPRFALALTWLRKTDVSSLAEGRHDIDGDACFAIIENGVGHDPAKRRFESHLRYIDLQISLSGGERMDVTPTVGLSVADDFQPGGDIAFYHEPDRAVTSLAVTPGMMAVFFPADAHKPSLRLSEPATAFRKVVIKVAL